MSWRQIRRSGGLPDIVKGMIEEQQRQQAESGIEDINDLEQARVDFDTIVYSDFGTGNLNGTESDTDAVNYADSDEPMTRGRIFRLCGGDATSFTIADAPSGAKFKTGDTLSKDGGFGRNEAAIIGHSVMGGP